MGDRQKQGMSFSVTVTGPEEDRDEWLDIGLRKQLLGAAVQHIVKELTPDRMEKWATKLVDDAFKDVRLYDIRTEIEAVARPYAKQLLARPEMQERIKKITEEAVEEVLRELPNEVKSLVVNKMAEALRR